VRLVALCAIYPHTEPQRHRKRDHMESVIRPKSLFVLFESFVVDLSGFFYHEMRETDEIRLTIRNVRSILNQLVDYQWSEYSDRV